ncbi:MAG TPA: flagellar export chaperone FlgN [Verrucomicrobiae bacterium]|jgi:flagellar biosynthesis/type III secretory pathway chaperone|nr:flagellar export chaperone FlgN [Verrucomicrobiae bacterium]
MNELLQNLIEALREELKEYGEMLALLDQQQEMVTHRQTQDLLQCVACVNVQAEAIAAARCEREQRQREVARELKLEADAPFNEVVPKLPAQFQPLMKALVQENNQLLARIQQRARQNHLLLTRIVDLMQRFLGSLFPGNPTTYDQAGQLLASSLPQRTVYDAIG